MVDLIALAKEVLTEWGLEPEFSIEAVHQLAKITEPAAWPENALDLRALPFCSIDNDDSRDLDQLTYGEPSTLWVAVADVEALVLKNTPIDQHAHTNTTSIYTPAKVFSMLPEKLSTDLTSLNENEDRVALVTKIEIDTQGNLLNWTIFLAIVHNYAKLTYNGVGPWLEGTGKMPEKIAQVPGLEETLRTQHAIAQLLKIKRHKVGSLTLDTSKMEARINERKEILLEVSPHNFAHQLIEEFMIAANNALALQLSKEKIPTLRRVVRVPQRWDKIVQVAKNLNETLPEEPDAKALDAFLIKRQKEDPESFADLSLTVIKLMGSGEYVVENAGDVPLGHFALALSDYMHSTAPNRRYPDLISQRQYKAHLLRKKGPYNLQELYQLAEHCTQQEDAVKKAERRLNKSAAALYLSKHIGNTYRGIITGASNKGTWVRLFAPPIEGKVVKNFANLDVGDKVAVKLIGVDVMKGYIDFEATTTHP